MLRVGFKNLLFMFGFAIFVYYYFGDVSAVGKVSKTSYYANEIKGAVKMFPKEPLFEEIKKEKDDKLVILKYMSLIDDKKDLLKVRIERMSEDGEDLLFDKLVGR